MNRGIRSGWGPQPGIAVPRYPKLLARATNSVTSQTGVTTEVDLSGLTIVFSVTLYPVKVKLWVPFDYQSLAGQGCLIRITDGSNVVSHSTNTAAAGNNYGQGQFVEETIYIPGAYTRKGRISNNSGSGTANTFVSSDFEPYLEAYEIAA